MEIYDISTDEGNLEDVFIDLTKNQISLKKVVWYLTWKQLVKLQKQKKLLN